MSSRWLKFGRLAAGCAFACMWSGQASAQEFKGCDDAEINEIVGAAAVAETVMRIAEQDLDSIEDGGDATRFETYLGPVTRERIDYVRSMLYAIWQGSLANASYYCNHPCPGGANARADQGSALGSQKTYGVYLCARFMTDLDTYERATTLIHEFAHQYGAWDPPGDIPSEGWETWAKNLAADSPEAAISSAWNLQFYIDQ